MDKASNSTVIVDEHLNVKRRLAQLQAWREEWKREDDLLATEVAQLDPGKPHDLQRGAQIASVRRRLQVQWVKVPLELSAAAIQRIGYEPLRQHLGGQYAQLTVDERRCWLDNLLLIITPDLRLLQDKMANLRDYNARGQQRNMLLGGPSGIGKTNFLNWYISNDTPMFKGEHNQVPIIKIDAPINTTSAKPFFQRLLLECGVYDYNRGDEESLLMQLIMHVQQSGVEMVIVDEIEHMMRPHLRRRVLELSNLTPDLPIICASCEPLRWVQGDIELASRWSHHFELCLYTGNRLRELLAYIELLLPFAQPSSLAQYEIVNGTKSGKVTAGPARLIEQWTGGVLRDIMLLILESSRRAITNSLPCLTIELLAETWHAFQTKQEMDFRKPIRYS